MQNTFTKLPREVQIVISASFFVALGFGIVLPSIPVFARSFGVSHAAVGFVVSFFAFFRFSSGLFSGKIVDKLGERTVFASGVLIVSVSVFLVGISQNYWQMLIFRAIGGIGSSMFSVAANSVVLRKSTDDIRAQAQSVYNGTFLLGGIAGPAIGGALASISLRAPFFVYSATLLVSGTIAYFFLSNEKPSSGAEEGVFETRTTLREALDMKPYRIAIVMAFIGSWVLFGLRASIMPLFVTEELHSTAAVVGYGFTISALIQGIFLMKAGRLSDQRGRKVASVIGTSIVASGILFLIFAIHPWMYLASMAILGLGGAFLGLTPASIVGDVIEGRGGQVIGFFQMAGDAGMMIGPIAVGFISDHYGYRSAFIASGLVFIIAFVLATQIPETRRTHLSQGFAE